MRGRLTAIVTAAVFYAVLGAPAHAEAKEGMGGKEYAGSEKCGTCHKTQYRSWKETYHSKMVRRPADGLLKAAAEKWATDGATPGPAVGNVTGKPFALNDVAYVIGSNWKQRYLVKDDTTGGYQFLDKQFNRMNGTWEKYGNKNDWDTMCATCHTTGYRLTAYDPADPKAQKAEWSELNIGCESCHGPGAAHIKSRSKKDIWNFAGKSFEEKARVCGYCHIRVENELYKSAQGNPREDLPAPKAGDSFKPSDDWRKWYPEHVVIPGVQPEDKVDAEYAGDLKGLFVQDNAAKATGVYPAAKHHQEYQELLQSAHYKKGAVTCIDCHSPHATKKEARKDPKKSCANCHDASYVSGKYMPGTGKTADNLFVRTHTFVKENADRKGGPTATGTPEYKKK
jgi:formate-dependent nitrite reductase cytochrome c552 subunit